MCQDGLCGGFMKGPMDINNFLSQYWAFDTSLQQYRDFVCGKHQTGDSQLIDVCHGIGVFEQYFEDIG